MSRYYENIQIMNMLNKESHENDESKINSVSDESNESKINSLSDEEEHDSVCSETSDTVSSIEKGENEEYGNKHEELNVFVSKEQSGTKFHF